MTNTRDYGKDHPRFSTGGPVDEDSDDQDSGDEHEKPIRVAGGNDSTLPAGFDQIQNHLTEYARGNAKSNEVQKTVRRLGWSGMNLRKKGSSIEVFDPTGKAHYIDP